MTRSRRTSSCSALVASASIARSIDRLASTGEQREVLRDLVAAYPGMLLSGQNQYFNPVRDQFERLRARSRAEAGSFVEELRGVSERFGRAFRDSCEAERRTIGDDLAWMENRLREAPSIQFRREPLAP